MTVKTIDAKTAKSWLDQGQAVLIDVRENAEHKAEHIKAASLVPLGTVSKSTLPETGGKKIIIHCGGGSRAGRACDKLLAEDPDLELYNLEGGIKGWREAGHPVKKSGQFFLPLDQQVQLTIGLFVLAGSLLGYFLNPIFFLLSGFFGAGLIFAGLSGFCGLGILMAKMPWNRG